MLGSLNSRCESLRDGLLLLRNNSFSSSSSSSTTISTRSPATTTAGTALVQNVRNRAVDARSREVWQQATLGENSGVDAARDDSALHDACARAALDEDGLASSEELNVTSRLDVKHFQDVATSASREAIRGTGRGWRWWWWWRRRRRYSRAVAVGVFLSSQIGSRSWEEIRSGCLGCHSWQRGGKKCPAGSSCSTAADMRRRSERGGRLALNDATKAEVNRDELGGTPQKDAVEARGGRGNLEDHALRRVVAGLEELGGLREGNGELVGNDHVVAVEEGGRLGTQACGQQLVALFPGNALDEVVGRVPVAPDEGVVDEELLPVPVLGELRQLPFENELVDLLQRNADPRPVGQLEDAAHVLGDQEEALAVEKQNVLGAVVGLAADVVVFLEVDAGVEHGRVGEGLGEGSGELAVRRADEVHDRTHDAIVDVDGVDQGRVALLVHLGREHFRLCGRLGAAAEDDAAKLVRDLLERVVRVNRVPDPELLADLLERREKHAAVAEPLAKRFHVVVRDELVRVLEARDEGVLVGVVEADDAVERDVLGAQEAREVVEILEAAEVLVDDEAADRLAARLRRDALVQHLIERVEDRLGRVPVARLLAARRGGVLEVIASREEAPAEVVVGQRLDDAAAGCRRADFRKAERDDAGELGRLLERVQRGVADGNRKNRGNRVRRCCRCCRCRRRRS